MSFFENEKNVDEYIKMVDRNGGSRLINILRKYLKDKSSLLEIGMGPGYDLEILQSDYMIKISDMPRYFPSKISSWQLDLRGKNLSEINIKGRMYDLMHSTFDNYTIWPDFENQKINPLTIMNNNLNPGLGINLHGRNITGDGIKVAIIDQANTLFHSEYGDRIVFYKSFGLNGTEPTCMSWFPQ